MTNKVKAAITNARRVNKHVVGFDVTAGPINLYFGYKKNSVETAVMRNGKVTDQTTIQLITALRKANVDTTILEKAIGHLTPVCQHCKKALSTGVVSYCKRHAIGAVCYDCQKLENEVALTDNGGASEASANTLNEVNPTITVNEEGPKLDPSMVSVTLPRELLASLVELELPSNTKRELKALISELQDAVSSQVSVIGESAPLSTETLSQPVEAPVAVTPDNDTTEAAPELLDEEPKHDKESSKFIDGMLEYLNAEDPRENDRENEPSGYNNVPVDPSAVLGLCQECGRSGVELVKEGVCELCE